MSIELTPDKIHNICVCLIRTAKAVDTTDDQMLYLLNLVQELKANVAAANDRPVSVTPTDEPVVQHGDIDANEDAH